MIIVEVKLLSAITGKETQLGRMVIANDGMHEDHPRKGNYEGRILRKPDFRRVTRMGKVEGHARQAKTIWSLVGQMLVNMGYVGGKT